MKAKGLGVLAAACLLSCDSGTEPSPGRTSPGAPVSVFAASSLREVVSEIAAAWTRRTGREHRLQFESTSTLARQIKAGARADVFISAAPEWLEAVTVLDRFDWLSNRLVCVVPKDDSEFDWAKIDSLAIADEQVPAGKYARQALAKSGVAIPARTIYGHSVRDVLSKVTSGGARVGVVYATDAALEPAVRVAHAFEPEMHDRILYSVGLVSEEGRTLFEALKEGWTMEAAKRYGFSAAR